MKKRTDFPKSVEAENIFLHTNVSNIFLSLYTLNKIDLIFVS